MTRTASWSRVLAALAGILCLSGSVSGEPPDRRRPIDRPPVMVRRPTLDARTRTSELELMKRWRAQVTNPSSALTQFLLKQVDYSGYVTFQRTQNNWGGCFHYAALHAIDILNEMRAPFTPDVSYRFLEYWATKRFFAKPPGDRAQQEALGVEGSCSEADLHTNYDLGVAIPSGKDEDHDGKIDPIMDFVLDQGAVPRPTAADNAEGKLYRVSLSPPYPPSVNNIKWVLTEYGPAWVDGRFHWSLGLGEGEGHVVCVVGFDDDKRTFKCLNSWGQVLPKEGFFDLKYDDIDRLWQYKNSTGVNVTESELWSVRFLENGADDRADNRFAYSARISIRHSTRRSLTVKVGVVGLEPLVVWDRPNRKNLIDNCGSLIIDVPLPAYAAQHWPPSEENVWFVQAVDGDKDGQLGAIDGFTVARFYKNSSCKSVGSHQTETFQPQGQLGTVIPEDGTVATTYLPMPPKREHRPGGLRLKGGGGLLPIKPARVEGQTVALSAATTNVPMGGQVTLTATVTNFVLGRPMPMPGQPVSLYWAHAPQVAYRNRPEEFTPVRTLTAGPDGTCVFVFKSDFISRQFAAAISDASGKVLASSPKVAIGQIVK